ncbi:MAG: helix-turn-helix domain-containing protein [Treponemataceae bacterium]
MAQKLLTSKDVAKICNCEAQTVSRWAARNDVNYVGENRRKIYLFTEADLERFKSRNTKRGRPKVTD